MFKELFNQFLSLSSFNSILLLCIQELNGLLSKIFNFFYGWGKLKGILRKLLLYYFDFELHAEYYTLRLRGVGDEMILRG